MKKGAKILPFGQKEGYHENELEKLLKIIDDPQNDSPEFLFEQLANLDCCLFQDKDGYPAVTEYGCRVEEDFRFTAPDSDERGE